MPRSLSAAAAASFSRQDAEQLVHRVVAAGKPGSRQPPSRTGSKSFVRWRRAHGLPDIHHLYDGAELGLEILHWVATLHAKTSLRASTVDGYLTDVRKFITHITGSPPAEPFILSDFRRRWRQLDAPSHPKSAASPRLIKHAADSCGEPAIRAAILLQYYGMSRAGEFCYTDRSRFDPEYDLLWGDALLVPLVPGEDPILFLYRKRDKTDRHNAGSFKAFAPTGGEHCPIRALLQLKDASTRAGIPTGPDDPIFVLHGSVPKGPAGKLLATRDVSNALKRAAVALNLDPDDYSSHSIRSGAAKAAADAGVPEAELKLRGGWATDCYLSYIRTSPDRLHALIKALDIDSVGPDARSRDSWESVAAHIRRTISHAAAQPSLL